MQNLVKPSDIPLRSSRSVVLANELTLIFHRMGLDTGAVLDAAGTKWNFHRYTPGLVGGHCIPVDPYYLVHKAEELGHHPPVILAGRAINDSMPGYVALVAIKGLNGVGKVIKGSKVLIMGLTYKENVPDTRESPVGVEHDEFREVGQFMAMDEAPVLIDVRDSLGDLSRTHAGFGYAPRYGVEDGLKETIRWFMGGT